MSPAPAAAATGAPAGPAIQTHRVDPSRLHNFDRTPDEVLAQGRAHVDPEERARIEELTAVTWDRLTAAKLAITAPHVD